MKQKDQEKQELTAQEQLEPIDQDKLESTAQEQLEPIGQDRLESTVQEQLEPIGQDRLESTVQEQLEPIGQDRLESTVQEQLEPIGQDRLESTAQEQLEPIAQDQLDPITTQKSKSAFREIVESLAIAVLLAIIIRTFLFTPYHIPSESMVPTIEIGDRVISTKLAYVFNEPKLGDVMVFKYPLNPRANYVKRVIGTGGDIVFIRSGQLYVNGKKIEEDYLSPDLDLRSFGPIMVPPDCYFMMGDNRRYSDDSRMWGFVPEDNVVGRAMLTFWPVNRIRLL